MSRIPNAGPFEALLAVLAAMFAGMTLYGLTSGHGALAAGSGVCFLALGASWWWSHRLGLRRRRY